MKKLGILLIALSLLLVGTTYNIGLLNERQSVIYLSGVLFLAGVICFGFGVVAKEESKNIKAFALWTFLTTIVSLIGMKVVTDIQEANRQTKIRLQIAKEQEEIQLQIANAQAKQAEILKENSDKFIDNKDGTVTFKSNGLMWQRCSVGQTWTGETCSGDATKMTWADAMKLTSNFAGHNDWRLPTKAELMQLVVCSDGKSDTDGSCTNYMTVTRPTINTTNFPNTPSVWFWSSSPGAGFSSNAWGVYFYYGYSYGYYKSSYGNVRLVR